MSPNYTVFKGEVHPLKGWRHIQLTSENDDKEIARVRAKRYLVQVTVE